MIDSPLPIHKSDSFTNAEFTLEEEKTLIGEFNKKLINPLTNLQTIKACWELAAENFGKDGSPEAIMNKLPKDIANLITVPDDSNALNSTIKSINTIRSLRNALKNYSYISNEELDAQLIYMKAQTSDTNLKPLEDGASKSIIIIDLDGNHYDLLKEPFVRKVAGHIKRYL